MATSMLDINTAIESRMQTVLGADYQLVPYREDLAKNSFRGGVDRFCSRALDATETSTVTKFVTFNQTFEVTLTTQYYESNVDDAGQVSTGYDLRAKVLDIYTDLINTRLGIPSVVLNVSDLSIASPEYIEAEKVIIQRATMQVFYRLQLP